MKFSTFVKLGGHAFSLLQNKDLMELYGMAKPTLQKQIQGANPSATPTSPPPLQHWPTATYPTHFPIPIDSPFLKGRVPPYGARPYGGPGWFYGSPPAYPPHRGNTQAVNRNKTNGK